MNRRGVVFQEKLLLDTANRVQNIHAIHGQDTPAIKLVVLNYTGMTAATHVRMRRTRFLVC